MPKITIDLDLKLLPQLIVLSAITNSPARSEPFIENHCCMVRDGDELQAEVQRWIEDIQEGGFQVVKVVARHVPRSVYAAGRP